MNGRRTTARGCQHTRPCSARECMHCNRPGLSTTHMHILGSVLPLLAHGLRGYLSAGFASANRPAETSSTAIESTTMVTQAQDRTLDRPRRGGDHSTGAVPRQNIYGIRACTGTRYTCGTSILRNQLFPGWPLSEGPMGRHGQACKQARTAAGLVWAC